MNRYVCRTSSSKKGELVWLLRIYFVGKLL